MFFTLEWLKKQQENSPGGLHWYVTSCDCKDCCEVRKTLTVPPQMAQEGKKARARRR